MRRRQTHRCRCRKNHVTQTAIITPLVAANLSANEARCTVSTNKRHNPCPFAREKFSKLSELLTNKAREVVPRNGSNHPIKRQSGKLQNLNYISLRSFAQAREMSNVWPQMLKTMFLRDSETGTHFSTRPQKTLMAVPSLVGPNHFFPVSVIVRSSGINNSSYDHGVRICGKGSHDSLNQASLPQAERKDAPHACAQSCSKK